MLEPCTFAIAHRAFVLESGKLVLARPAHELLGDERLKRAYLGRYNSARTSAPARITSRPCRDRRRDPA